MYCFRNVDYAHSYEVLGGVKGMYVFIVKKIYNEYEFLFDDFYEGCKFMMTATEHCTEELTFTVYKEVEVKDEE